MLFSVPECLGIADLTSFTSVACNDLDRLVPHRYAALFDRNITSRCQFHAQVVILLNRAGFKPTKIQTRGGFAIDINSRYVSDLSILVSSLDKADLHVKEDQTSLSIIKAICMNEKPKLRSFTITDGELAQKCVSLILEAPVIGLESVHCPIPVCDSDCKRFGEFLSGQINIKELELFGEVPDNNYCKRDQCLLSCIENLFVRSDFEHFQLRHTQMTQYAFTVLLNSFLSAPASKQKKVVVYSFDVFICECHAQKAVMPYKVGSNSLEYKEVTFMGYDEYSGLDPLLKCLSNVEIQLKRLEFQRYTLENINLFTAVFSSSTFAVREVRPWWVEFPRLLSESDFHILDGLLSKPCLKVFEFSGIVIGGELEEVDDELKLVANGLTKQASVGTLESFIYDEFEESLYGAEGVEDFVRALLCLPQFLQLHFSLRYPDELASMANEIWEECANGRTLKPSPSNCQNSLLRVMLEHLEK